MRRALAAIGLLTVWALAGAGAGAAPAPLVGHLVLLGGGDTPASVFTRTLELSGGRSALVAVLPQTYPNDSIGDTAVAMWKAFGAREVVKVGLTDQRAAIAALERATLIWMPGGFQGLLMKALAGTPVPDEIRKRFAEGATVGGASAGAAVVSSMMAADDSMVQDAGNRFATANGLGLWPQAIVVPHFSERQQMNTLVGMVREHPTLLGVGIDEGTAAFVSGVEIEAMGNGSIVVVDGRNVEAIRATRGQVGVPWRPIVRTLRAGMRFRME